MNLIFVPAIYLFILLQTWQVKDAPLGKHYIGGRDKNSDDIISQVSRSQFIDINHHHLFPVKLHFTVFPLELGTYCIVLQEIISFRNV